jgi:hypothetical protein
MSNILEDFLSREGEEEDDDELSANEKESVMEMKYFDPNFEYKVNTWCDVKDSVGEWRLAKIKKKKNNQIFVAFDGWSDRHKQVSRSNTPLTLISGLMKARMWLLFECTQEDTLDKKLLLSEIAISHLIYYKWYSFYYVTP